MEQNFRKPIKKALEVSKAKRNEPLTNALLEALEEAQRQQSSAKAA
tara:strand:+ start:261 stop:398 length:138 start_codon:yes stop_codon:yes gene_type:complete